jgi:large subunit ribosomal protein L22
MKRIRPAPMGRAFRYVRRIAHIEIALEERVRGNAGVATVVGDEGGGAKIGAKTKAKNKARAKGKAPVTKTKRKSEKKFAGAR